MTLGGKKVPDSYDQKSSTTNCVPRGGGEDDFLTRLSGALVDYLLRPRRQDPHSSAVRAWRKWITNAPRLRGDHLPSEMAADRLRHTEYINKLPPSHTLPCPVRSRPSLRAFYSQHFGFRRAGAYRPGPAKWPLSNRIMSISNSSPPIRRRRSCPPGNRAGAPELSEFIPGMRAAWLADPEGNIVDLNPRLRR